MAFARLYSNNLEEFPIPIQSQSFLASQFSSASLTHKDQVQKKNNCLTVCIHMFPHRYIHYHNDVQGDHGGLTLCFVDFDLVCSSICPIVLGQVKLGRDGMANG